MSSIISELPNLEKRVLLSATSDVEIPEFVGMDSAVTLNFTQGEQNDSLALKLVVSSEKDKIDTLFKLLCSLNSEAALIFCNHREVAERVSNLLDDKGIYSGYYHGGMDQDDRERILIQFRNGSLNYLITTDLGARGLDIPEMKHVIHYHLPAKDVDFTHRNGRTARMNASVTAYIVMYKEDVLPEYIPQGLDIMKLKEGNPLPKRPEYQTIYISGGKKNKLNKSDIVGFFLQIGNINKDDLGLIEVKDFISFAAVKTSVAKTLLSNIRDQKMKGKKYKIEVARGI